MFTGAGKSHLINVLFNQVVCDTTPSYEKVTKEVYFIRGRDKDRDLVVIDTVGLCENDCSGREVIDFIKERSSNLNKIHAVYVVLRTGRMQQTEISHIKQMLEILNFQKNFPLFKFVGTHAEYLSEQQITNLAAEAKQLFGMAKEAASSVIYVGFPPENNLNSESKERVLQSFLAIKNFLVERRDCEPITI